MNRKLRLLAGMSVLAVVLACNEGTTAVRVPGLNFQWMQQLPPPPTLSVIVNPDPNQPNNSEGTFTYTTTVSGGSGTYTYHWYWRSCNMNGGSEWCPSSYFESAETGSAFTYTIGPADTKIDFLVEVQEVTSSDTPATGKGNLWTAGPMYGTPGSGEEGQTVCDIIGYPLSRHALNPNTGQWQWVNYRRNPCTGAVEWPA
jgi:hypothetical protein